MTGVDRMTPAEQALRDELHRDLVPPPTPASLHRIVERLEIAVRVEEQAARDRQGSRIAGAPRWLVGAAALAAVFVLVIAILPLGIADRAGSATPVPSIPLPNQSALPSSPPNATTLSQAAWLDARTAWSVDAANRLRMSTDGAQTWSEPRPLPAATDLGFDVHDARRLSTGWIVSRDDHADVNAYTSDDGGATWSTSPVASLERAFDMFGNVHFADPDHGIFLVTSADRDGSASNCLGWSTDVRGRSDWTELASPPCLGAGGIVWADALTGLLDVSPSERSVALTRDGGRTWATGILPAGVDRPYKRLGLSADGEVVRLILVPIPEGASGPRPVVVVETTDGGTSWTEVERSTAMNGIDIQALQAFDADHWLASVDEGGIPGLAALHETFDGGRSWARFADTGLSVGGYLAFADRLHGAIQGVLLVGDCRTEGCGGTGTVWLTNDGGRTWHAPPF